MKLGNTSGKYYKVNIATKKMCEIEKIILTITMNENPFQIFVLCAFGDSTNNLTPYTTFWTPGMLKGNSYLTSMPDLLHPKFKMFTKYAIYQSILIASMTFKLKLGTFKPKIFNIFNKWLSGWDTLQEILLKIEK